MEFKIFNNIQKNKVDDFLKKVSLHKQKYKRGECILKSGNTTDKIHMINSGSIEVVHYDFWGNKFIIGNFTKGNMFAESYALSKVKELQVDVYALEETEIFSFSTANIVDICFQIDCPKLISNLLEEISNKNFHLAKRLQLVTQKGVRKKILLYLSDYSKSIGKTTFKIPLNRQQLADYLSVDRSGLSAILVQLKKDKILDFRRNYFTLYNNDN